MPLLDHNARSISSYFVSGVLGALYDALLHPGDKDLALKAAEETAAYENRFSRIETDLTVLKWMAGTNVGLTIVVLGRLFFS
ncbi:MAG: integrase [Acidimicrobiia bacterium]|nr:integrase [Acidimicrobiia bacterium]